MNKKMIGIILMSVGGLLLLSGFVIFNSYKKPDNPIEQKAQFESTFDINKKKGDDFEKFIVQKFDKKFFKVKEWAGDKYVNGVYAESTLNPDLLMEIKLGKTVSQFSVECKWRKNTFNGKIEFAYDEQLARYRKYEQEKNIPVFIALGVGGLPLAPEKLYIIPLQLLNAGEIETKDLKQFETIPGKNLYYDLNTKELK